MSEKMSDFEYAIAFETTVKGSINNFLVDLSDPITGKLYFDEVLKRIDRIGNTHWFVVNGLVAAFTLPKYLPEHAKEKIKTMHVVRYTDHAVIDLKEMLL